MRRRRKSSLRTSGRSASTSTAWSTEGKLVVDYVHVDRSEIEENGEYDLEGLFIRLGLAIDSIGARRVVLDTIETLFGGLANEAVLRAELRRLFRWLKDRGVTADRHRRARRRDPDPAGPGGIRLRLRDPAGPPGRRTRSRPGGCASSSTADARTAPTNIPFLIDEDGISVLPVTSLGLDHEASDRAGLQRRRPASTACSAAHGYYRGSSILISGTAGTGKTSLAAHFADAACRRGERCLYFAFEESQSQLVRNMRSIGLDLRPWIDGGLLRFQATRPTLHGLEMHLATMHQDGRDFRPRIVVVDPISNMLSRRDDDQAQAMLVRLIDSLKGQQITALFTNLTSAGDASLEQTDIGISSIDRHLAPAAGHRAGGRAKSRDLCPQVPRHGTLEPDPRIPAH